MRKLIFITSLVLTCLITQAQDSVVAKVEVPKNNLGVSLFGQASQITVNYERKIPFRNRHFLSFGIGVGASADWDIFYSTGIFATLPHHITYNIGRSKHFLELGAGATLLYNKNSRVPDYSYFLYPIVGYRFQSVRKWRPFLRLYSSMPFGVAGRDLSNYFLLLQIPGGPGITLGLTF